MAMDPNLRESICSHEKPTDAILFSRVLPDLWGHSISNYTI